MLSCSDLTAFETEQSRRGGWKLRVSSSLIARMLREVEHSRYPARDRVIVLLSVRAGLASEGDCVRHPGRWCSMPTGRSVTLWSCTRDDPGILIGAFVSGQGDESLLQLGM
jgi:hypothetical protein